MVFARIGHGSCYHHWNEIFAGVSYFKNKPPSISNCLALPILQCKLKIMDSNQIGCFAMLLFLKTSMILMANMLPIQRDRQLTWQTCKNKQCYCLSFPQIFLCSVLNQFWIQYSEPKSTEIGFLHLKKWFQLTVERIPWACELWLFLP